MHSIGMYNYNIPVSFLLKIYKEVDGERYYLCNDNNFYTNNGYNSHTKCFNSAEERDEYLKYFDERLKMQYGDDIKYEFSTLMRSTGYCKKL